MGRTIVVDELYRFRMLVAGIMVALGVSTTYGYSIFTEYMKEKYGMNQVNITTISTVGNCLGYCAFLLGVVFDLFGPKIQILLSGSLAALGLLLFGLSFDDKISYSTETMVILLSIFNGIMFLGCPSLDGGSVLPLMMNFPLDRGFIIVIQKTFSGLGTSVMMLYFNAFFKTRSPDQTSKFSAYAYFLAAQVMLVSVVGAIFIDFPTYNPCDWKKKKLAEEELKERQDTLKLYMTQRPPHRRFYIGCTILGTLLVFLTTISLVGSFDTLSPAANYAAWAIGIFLLCCFSLMGLPFQWLGAYPVPARPSKFRALGELNHANVEEEDKTAEGRYALSEPVEEKDGDNEGERKRLASSPKDKSVASISSSGLPSPVRHRQGEAGHLSDEGSAHDPAVEYLHIEEKSDGDEPGRQKRDVVLFDEKMNEEDTDAEREKYKFGATGDPQYHGSFWSHLLTIDLWLFWLCFFSMWGTGTVLIFNAAQLYRSKAYGHFAVTHQALYVGLIGVGSAIGRILSGLMDMWVTRRRTTGEKKKNIYTIMFLPVSSILLGVSFLLIVVLPAEAIVLPFILGAMGNGMGWGLGALCVRIVYADDIGKHYNFMWSSGIVATVALNLFMFGGMFDNTARKEGTLPMCDTPACVIPQMWILLACNAVSTLAAVLVQWRFCSFSNKRLKEAEYGMEKGTTLEA